MENILVAGGPRSLVFGNLSRNLNQYGLKVGWHIDPDERNPQAVIPEGCDGVVLVRDFISHRIAFKVTDAAEKAGVPHVAISRKWSAALPILRMQGFIAPVPQAQRVPSGDVIASTVTEMVQQTVMAGRVPTLTEVTEAAAKAFGQRVTVSAQIVAKAISRAQSERAKAMTLHDPPVTVTDVKRLLGGVRGPVAPNPGVPFRPFEAVVVSPEKPMSRLAQIVATPGEERLLVETMVSDDPDLSLFPDQVAKTLTEHTTLLIPDATQVAKRELALIKERWEMEWAFRKTCQMNWLTRRFRKVHQEDVPWPSFLALRDESERVFGQPVPHALTQEARVKVLGAWAAALDRNCESQKYLKVRRPDLDLNVLVRAGDIPSIKVLTRHEGVLRRITSLRAVRDYLDGLEAPLLDVPKEMTKFLASVTEAPVAPVVAPVEVTPLTVAPAPPAPVPGVTADDLTTLATMVEEAVGARVEKILKHALQAQQEAFRVFIDRQDAQLLPMEQLLNRVEQRLEALESKAGQATPLKLELGGILNELKGLELRVGLGTSKGG